MTLDEATFVILDFEATTADPQTAEILEVAAIHMDAAGNSFARFETLVAPTGKIPAEASGIHGLVDEDFRHAPALDIALSALREFIPPFSSIVVAHNGARYDFPLLARLGITPHRSICSERLAHHLVPDAPNFKLGTLRYHLCGSRPIETGEHGAHRAMADVLVLAAVFDELLARAKARNIEDVDDLLDLANTPYELRKMPFGRHRGEDIDDVPISYYEWALNGGMPEIDRDLRFTFEQSIARRRGRAA